MIASLLEKFPRMGSNCSTGIQVQHCIGRTQLLIFSIVAAALSFGSMQKAFTYNVLTRVFLDLAHVRVLRQRGPARSSPRFVIRRAIRVTPRDHLRSVSERMWVRISRRDRPLI